jgi:hypothetical protein
MKSSRLRQHWRLMFPVTCAPSDKKRFNDANGCVEGARPCDEHLSDCTWFRYRASGRRCLQAADAVGTVTVEVAQTSSKVPSALDKIQKVKQRRAIGKKRSTAKG